MKRLKCQKLSNITLVQFFIGVKAYFIKIGNRNRCSIKRGLVSTICGSTQALEVSQVDDKDVLLTIDSEPVFASEFIRVYSKNLDLVQDENQKNIDSYLELFVNYQLKINKQTIIKLHLFFVNC